MGSPPTPPRARTCAGCTYFSRALHAQGREPVCAGLRGTRAVDAPVEPVPLPPDVAAGGPFSSVCLGFAVWPARPSTDTASARPPASDDDASLPQCMGVQIIRAQAVAASPALAGVGGEARHNGPASRAAAPPSLPPGDAALSLLARWERSAGRVARRMLENASVLFGGGGRE